MSKKSKIILASAATALTLAVSSGATALWRASDRAQEKLSNYEKTGETVACLSTRSVRSADALDDYSMLISAGGEMYLNELNGRCIGLGREQRYVHQSTQSRMCRGDIISVMDSFGMSLGSCSFGDFEKLSEIPKDE